MTGLVAYYPQHSGIVMRVEQVVVERDPRRRAEPGDVGRHPRRLARGIDDQHVGHRDTVALLHDIDVDVLDPEHGLVEQLKALPGRKLVFTNGDEPYARRVMDRLQISTAFEAVHCIIAMDYLPKPDSRAYESLIKAHDVDPHRSIFVEDMARNLTPAKALGMTTVWLDNGAEWGSRDACPAHIDITIPGLQPWLKTTSDRLKATT